MIRPVKAVLAILCVVSLYRPFSMEANALEFVGYVSMALLSALLLFALHVRPNDSAESIPPLAKPLRARRSARHAMFKQ